MRCYTVEFDEHGAAQATIAGRIVRRFDVGQDGRRVRVGAADDVLSYLDSCLKPVDLSRVPEIIFTNITRLLLPNPEDFSAQDILVALKAAPRCSPERKSGTLIGDARVLSHATCEWLIVLKPGQTALATVAVRGEFRRWRKTVATISISCTPDGGISVAHATSTRDNRAAGGRATLVEALDKEVAGDVIAISAGRSHSSRTPQQVPRRSERDEQDIPSGCVPEHRGQ
jgi:hypothetical protein